jgi:DNA-binding NtrC family response regulator
MSEQDKPSVLVVDAEQGLRDMLIFSLSDLGYRVVPAACGEEALKLSAGERFDAVVCDISMIGMNGVETLKALKAARPEVEVIMATGFATDELAAQLVRLGAYDCIAKPFDTNELAEILGRVIGRSKKTAAA